MNLEGFAAAVRDLAGRAEASLAHECAEAGAMVFLPLLKSTTPVRTGKLRHSETIDSVSGGGAYASAEISPHTIYAEFRETGGTITAKNFPQLGNPEVGFFGKSVTQAGSHYVARAHAAAEASVQVAMGMIAERFFEESGL